MLVYAKELIGKKIFEQSGMRVMGVIEDIIIDPDKGIVLGFLLEKRFFLEKERIVSYRDIREMFVEGLMISGEEDIIDRDEVIKIKNALDRKIFFLDSNVLTQNGSKIGQLEDLIFEKETGHVLTLITKKSRSSERRVISSDRIINVSRGKIIIRDLLEKSVRPLIHRAFGLPEV